MLRGTSLAIINPSSLPSNVEAIWLNLAVCAGRSPTDVLQVVLRWQASVSAIGVERITEPVAGQRSIQLVVLPLLSPLPTQSII